MQREQADINDPTRACSIVCVTTPVLTDDVAPHKADAQGFATRESCEKESSAHFETNNFLYKLTS
jgi:hypothetical protein